MALFIKYGLKFTVVVTKDLELHSRWLHKEKVSRLSAAD